MMSGLIRKPCVGGARLAMDEGSCINDKPDFFIMLISSVGGVLVAVVYLIKQ